MCDEYWGSETTISIAAQSTALAKFQSQPSRVLVALDFHDFVYSESFHRIHCQ